MAIDAFQADVARIALGAAGPHGFAPAGGNALVARGIVQRPTKDVDLFSNEAGAPGAVTAAVEAALEAAGYQVVITRPPELNQGEFSQMVVSRGDESMQLDKARDWRRWPPVELQVGPVLHLDDAVSSKVNAMVGRGAPRDFIDIAAAIGHNYSRAELMRLIFARDPGLRVVDFTQAMRSSTSSAWRNSPTTASAARRSPNCAGGSPTGPARRRTTKKVRLSTPLSPTRSDAQTVTHGARPIA